MALFGRNKVAAVGTSQDPEIKAAVGYGTGGNAGASQINNFYAYTNGEMRQIAMRVPTISRARDLMASVIGCLKLEMYRDIWNGDEMEPVSLAPRAWLARIDPSVTNNFILSWTFDDLFFYGRAFWYIKSRTADGYPASFERLPAAMVTTQDQAGPLGRLTKFTFRVYLSSRKTLFSFLAPSKVCFTRQAKPSLRRFD
jgi:hypothetical protein